VKVRITSRSTIDHPMHLAYTGVHSPYSADHTPE
jgi:hypothetical protein